MAPTPGTDINSRARVSQRAMARTCVSKRSNWCRSATRTANKPSEIVSRLHGNEFANPPLEARWRGWADLEAEATQNTFAALTAGASPVIPSNEVTHQSQADRLFDRQLGT
jgi:hypothetical protein